MSKEPKKPRGASSHRDWGIVARFADGSHAYYYIDGRYRESDSRPPER